MATVTLTAALRAEYVRLFGSCVIRPQWTAVVQRLVDTLATNRRRYEDVERLTGAPWGFVAVVHNMESSQSFAGHLHNGDPLTARTVQVPAGRPRTGSPPFTWVDSAVDAIKLKGLGAQTDWTLAGTLYQLERYNGFGYRRHHPAVLTPYLWSFSNHYTSGKYVADGTWSDTAVSKQCGAAVLLRRMAEQRLIGFADEPLASVEAAAPTPMISRYAMSKPADPIELNKAIALQNWLSGFPGIFLSPDGAPGKNTSDAYRLVTGGYLPGDPRGD